MTWLCEDDGGHRVGSLIHRFSIEVGGFAGNTTTLIIVPLLFEVEAVGGDLRCDHFFGG